MIIIIFVGYFDQHKLKINIYNNYIKTRDIMHMLFIMASKLTDDFNEKRLNIIEILRRKPTNNTTKIIN